MTLDNLLTREEKALLTSMTIGSVAVSEAIKTVYNAIISQGKSHDFAISTIASALASVKDTHGRSTMLNSNEQFIFVEKLGKEYNGSDETVKNMEFFVQNSISNKNFNDRLDEAKFRFIIREHLDVLTNNELEQLAKLKAEQSKSKIGNIPTL